MKRLIVLFLIVVFFLTIVSPAPVCADPGTVAAIYGLSVLFGAWFVALGERIKSPPDPNYDYQVTPWKNTRIQPVSNPIIVIKLTPVGG